jgi:hypothetical protein
MVKFSFSAVGSLFSDSHLAWLRSGDRIVLTSEVRSAHSLFVGKSRMVDVRKSMDTLVTGNGYDRLRKKTHLSG